MKMSRSDRPIAKRVRATRLPVSSDSDSDDTTCRNMLIAEQMSKFKTRKDLKRLHKTRRMKKNKKHDKKKLCAIKDAIIRLPDPQEDNVEANLDLLFREDVPEHRVEYDNNNNPPIPVSKPDDSFSTETAPTDEDKGNKNASPKVNKTTNDNIYLLLLGHDPVALALESADICLDDFDDSSKQNKLDHYKGKDLLSFLSLVIQILIEQHLPDLSSSTNTDDSDHEAVHHDSDQLDHLRVVHPQQQQQQHQQQQQQQQQHQPPPSITRITTDMPGPKDFTREERKGRKKEEEDRRKQEQRPSSQTRQGMKDPNVTIISSDEDDEQPSAKVSKPKTGGFREAITKAYNKKVEETKSKRAAEGKLRVDDNLDLSLIHI